jgi:SAM-dependent methyltransferase
VTSREAIDFYNAADPSRHGREQLEGEIESVAAWYARCPESLRGRPVLELGCGRGPLSKLTPSYAGLDLSLGAISSARPRFRGINGDMELLPIRARSVAFIFSWAAIEHVPHPERVLHEVERVLLPGGIAVLNPAWHCRPWAAEGLEFRPSSELKPGQRIRKRLIPLRNSLVLRAPGEIISRLRREIALTRKRALEFEYVRLTPNLAFYAGTDSDAFTSMDPHAMIAWFLSRGWNVLSHPDRLSRFRARHEPVVVQKQSR